MSNGPLVYDTSTAAWKSRALHAEAAQAEAADTIRRLERERDELAEDAGYDRDEKARLGFLLKAAEARAQLAEDRLKVAREALTEIEQLSLNASPDSGSRHGTFADGITTGWSHAASRARQALVSTGASHD